MKKIDESKMVLDFKYIYTNDIFFARSALSPPWCNKICCPSVRSFVRPFGIIIVFCEEDLGVAHMLLSTGSLNLRFFRIQKSEHSKMKLRSTGSTSEDSFGGRFEGPFWRKVSKTQHSHNRPYPVGVWVPNQWSSNWRAATYERETLVQVDFSREHCRMERSASRPCRARRI